MYVCARAPTPTPDPTPPPAQTVGYGDLAPSTWRGQLFACFVIMCGVVFLAMPIAIVGRTFTQTWEERDEWRLQARVRQLLSRRGVGMQGVALAFQKHDVDGETGLSMKELVDFCGELELTGNGAGQLLPSEIATLWRSLDKSGRGTVSLEELTNAFFPGRANRRSRNSIGAEDMAHSPSYVQKLEDRRQMANIMHSLQAYHEEGAARQAAMARRVGTLEDAIGSVRTDLGELKGLMTALAQKPSVDRSMSRRHHRNGGRNGGEATATAVADGLNGCSEATSASFAPTVTPTPDGKSSASESFVADRRTTNTCVKDSPPAWRIAAPVAMEASDASLAA